MVTIILSIVLIVALVAYAFPFAVVYGQSMEPTYHEGDILLCRRVVFKRRRKYYCNEVYVYKAPNNDKEKYLVIKRVSFSFVEKKTTQLFMLGDNLPGSYDSRMYGLVDSRRVIAKVLFTIKRRRCNK